MKIGADLGRTKAKDPSLGWEEKDASPFKTHVSPVLFRFPQLQKKRKEKTIKTSMPSVRLLPLLLLLAARVARAVPGAADTSAGFLDFGADFVFGIVQDAYQFEGSLAAAGAGASHLHTWCAWNLAQPNNGGWQLCGDVGAGFYEHMRDDVALMATLGQKHLHFQIAWQCVFPDGGAVPNEEGLTFYDALIDALLAHNITPWVSLEVFDFPQVYQTRWGGWLGLPMVVEYRRLAETLFARFGDRVKHWFSFHEPDSLCASYPTGARFVGPRPNANDSSVQDPMRDHVYLRDAPRARRGGRGAAREPAWRRRRAVDYFRCKLARGQHDLGR